MIRGGIKYKLIKDHLGSVLAVVNSANGVIAQQLTYSTYGRVLSDSNPGFQPFGFAGGLYDSDTKLVRFGAREYNGTIGRWMTKDPILFNGGDTNLYGYVLQDPVNYWDPFGLWAFAPEYNTSPNGLQQPIKSIENIVDNTFRNITGQDATITFTTNGTHKPGSLHKGGNAIDLRTRNFNSQQVNQLVKQLQKNLGPNYDVLNEGDHIHLEYDPKRGCK